MLIHKAAQQWHAGMLITQFLSSLTTNSSYLQWVWYNDNAQLYKYVCITTNQPDTKSNPNVILILNSM